MQLLSHMLLIDVDIVPDIRPTTCVKTDEKRSRNEAEWMSAVARRFEQRQQRLMHFFYGMTQARKADLESLEKERR
jgi:predicted secreted protein